MNNYEIKRILVGIDFSESSLNALETAIAICKRQSASLIVLHVIETSYVLPTQNEILSQEFFTNPNQTLSQLAQKISVEHNVVVNHLVRVGKPASEICQLVKSDTVDLAVVGTHGRSALQSLLMGSIAFDVIRCCSCPVLVVPIGSKIVDFKRILFPVRLASSALEKYAVIRPIIKKNKSYLLIAGIILKDESNASEKMRGIIAPVEALMSEDGVTFESELHDCDNVTKQVLALCNAERPDLIVITATLESFWRELFPGTFTEEIVNRSHFPILSIRPQ